MNNKVTKRDTLLNAMWYPEPNYQKTTQWKTGVTKIKPRV